MRYEDLRPQIKTGDVLICRGKTLVSKLIETFTGPDSHIAVFFWISDGLFIAQEYEGIGFQILPASQEIGCYDECYLGIAPAEVRGNSQGVLDCISKYRVTPSLQPYGYATLAKILIAHQTGIGIDPDSVQAVCSIFAQQCWKDCGYTFETLADPSDFERFCAGIVQIDTLATPT
jgi:hypothetical protein